MIGVLPNNWKYVRLAEYCDVRDGTHDSPKYVSSGYPLITSKNVKDGYIDFNNISLISEDDFNNINKRSKVDWGDIIMPMIGTIGNPLIVETDQEFAIKNVALMKFNQKLLFNRYTYYFLKSPLFEYGLNKINRGGTQKFISLGDIRNIQIPLPPPPEQKRIAAILDHANTICKKRQQTIKELNNLIPSIFYDMFGEHGLNPKAWPKKKIGEYCLKVEKYDPTQSPNKEFMYIDISSINNIDGQIESPQTLLGKDAPSRARQKMKLGDVIVATVRPNLRGTAWVTAEYDNQICSTGFSVLRPDQKHLTTDYLYTLTRDMWFTNSLISMTTGANYPAVRHKDILNLLIPVPPIHLQHDYSKKIMMLRNLQEKARIAMQDTSDLFNSLVQRAFKGEL
ncbi:MAG: restriction endonuclease subunit S [Planctomycetota bacterium]